MNSKFKSLLQLLLQSPRRFPVEAALGVVFFLMATCEVERVGEGDMFDDILWFFVPLVVLSFWLQRVNKWAYYASFFLFLPLMALDLKPFLWTYGFAFTYILAAILLVVGNRRMDNRSFSAHALHVVMQLFFGMLVMGILTLAVIAIIASFCYIFGIFSAEHIYEHVCQFIWFILAPQVCFTFIRQDEDEAREPAKVLRLILNYILSPAIVVYTVILYVYFITIALKWDLPKGGVAGMVMGFVTAALVGYMAQSTLRKRYFDWFYRHFTLIAIPPLIMYWIGSIYRICLYGFTESRFYLMVAGVLMTLFVLMLYWRRTRRFQLMAVILGAAIILFSYIPGISARSIGLRSQRQRMEKIIGELGLNDAKTGKLTSEIDMRTIRQDSLLCGKYREVSNVIRYVRDGIGHDEFDKQYGEWQYSEYDFFYNRPQWNEHWFYRKKPVELGDYTTMLFSESEYPYVLKGGKITFSKKSAHPVLEYPVDSIIRRDSTLLHHPERLFTYRNDSIMLVLEGICIKGSKVTFLGGYKLFKKSVKIKPHPQPLSKGRGE